MAQLIIGILLGVVVSVLCALYIFGRRVVKGVYELDSITDSIRVQLSSEQVVSDKRIIVLYRKQSR